MLRSWKRCTAVTAKKLCENLGCDVHAINEEINGDFPGRGSEPTPQNLDELSKLVVDTNSNLELHLMVMVTEVFFVMKLEKF